MVIHFNHRLISVAGEMEEEVRSVYHLSPVLSQAAVRTYHMDRRREFPPASVPRDHLGGLRCSQLLTWLQQAPYGYSADSPTLNCTRRLYGTSPAAPGEEVQAFEEVQMLWFR